MASYTSKGWMAFSLTGTVAHTGGDILNELNPEGHDLIITRAVVYCATNSGGAANLNVGVGTANEHDQTELVSAWAVGAAAGTAINGYANGDAADPLVIWGSTQYLLCNASASTAGFTGTLYIEYVHV